MSEVISKRKEKESLEKDLLGHLLNYKDDSGLTLTEDQIVDNIIGVLFAARDTTASVITWILKYLHDDRKLLEAVKVTTTFWSQMVLPGSNYILSCVHLGRHKIFLLYFYRNYISIIYLRVAGWAMDNI